MQSLVTNLLPLSLTHKDGWVFQCCVFVFIQLLYPGSICVFFRPCLILLQDFQVHTSCVVPVTYLSLYPPFAAVFYYCNTPPPLTHPQPSFRFHHTWNTPHGEYQTTGTSVPCTHPASPSLVFQCTTAVTLLD